MIQYTEKEMLSKYGKPNQSGSYLTSVKLPFKLALSWEPDTLVSKIRVHRQEAENVYNIFNDILNTYGISNIIRLRINYFGGSFNYRPMRNGNSWSKHAWGTAIDLDPNRNKLSWSNVDASFAREEYSDMIDIFEKYNWLSLGRTHNYDWMHFEAGKHV